VAVHCKTRAELISSLWRRTQRDKRSPPIPLPANKGGILANLVLKTRSAVWSLQLGTSLRAGCRIDSLARTMDMALAPGSRTCPCSTADQRVCERVARSMAPRSATWAAATARSMAKVGAASDA
jgi:hypothetical protein